MTFKIFFSKGRVRSLIKNIRFLYHICLFLDSVAWGYLSGITGLTGGHRAHRACAETIVKTMVFATPDANNVVKTTSFASLDAKNIVKTMSFAPADADSL